MRTAAESQPAFPVLGRVADPYLEAMLCRCPTLAFRYGTASPVVR
jgi:hypothetical protein